MGTVLPSGAPLVGRTVRLDPLTDADLPELFPLLADPEIYASGYVMHRRPETVEDGVVLARERFLPAQAPDGRGAGRTAYAIRLVDGDVAGTLVGTSSLLEAHQVNESIHLGSTLVGRRWWGSRVNPEAKLLLLAHCFEDCGYGRVKLQTDLLNTRSQDAIARLGARREGVLRRDQRREDGTFRDTVVFSVLADEWPAVKAGLQARLSA
jgi:RimJ/RimL family protein N-acetyltransferase